MFVISQMTNIFGIKHKKSDTLQCHLEFEKKYLLESHCTTNALTIAIISSNYALLIVAMAQFLAIKRPASML